MYNISVQGHFSAAHFLEDYEGLCGSVHGHRWEVVLSVNSDASAQTQMCIDFKDLKSTLNSLLDQMDHAFILDPNGNDVSKEFYALAKKHGMRVVEFSGRTTAENIARFIWKKLAPYFGTAHAVQVFEAPTNSVIYSEVENGYNSK